MNHTNSDTPSGFDEPAGPTPNSLKQLAGQLSQWRGMLPRELQWAEDYPASFPSPQQTGGINQALDPSLSQSQEKPLFTTDLDSDPYQYPYVYDIHVALLRTRYYYAKYMVYRPFIYKALHFPDQMTQDDAEGVAECLRVPSEPSPLNRKMETDRSTGLLKLAARTLSNISTQEIDSVPFLLVTNFSRCLAPFPYDTT